MATLTVRVYAVARTGRAKSPAFQRSIENLRKGRSYQEFANAIKTRTGIDFSRSFLKRVEGGTRAPNPLLLYALEVLAGRMPSALLLEYAQEAGASDLLGQGGTTESGSHPIGGADVPAEARIRELEDRLAAYQAIIRRIRKPIAEFIALVGDSDEGAQPARKSPGRRRRD